MIRKGGPHAFGFAEFVVSVMSEAFKSLALG